MRIIGVDGAKSGWIAVMRNLDGAMPAEARVFPSFEEIIAVCGPTAIIAVDMPIGLPDRCGPRGRGPDRHVRPLLGERQSSVFSVPSRAAVYCDDYWEACRVALETSDPPRKVSKQAFHLFPKIREIDCLMSVELEARVFEVHPEVAFWRLNGGRAMSLPKKVKGRANGPGLDQRRDLLLEYGFSREFLDQKPPRGAARDDLLDACVATVMAERIARGEAEPFPPDFERDSKGLRVAIWA